MLAGELAASDGDHAAAFARYEQALRKPVRACQAGGNRTGKFLAPATRFGIWARNWTMNTPFLLNLMLKAGQKISSQVELRDYAVGTRAAAA